MTTGRLAASLGKARSAGAPQGRSGHSRWAVPIGKARRAGAPQGRSGHGWRIGR